MAKTILSSDKIHTLNHTFYEPKNDAKATLLIVHGMTEHSGRYHQFAEFISGIAALPRIVTLHNFKMGPLTSDGNMTMDITAKTYRYFDEQGN